MSTALLVSRRPSTAGRRHHARLGQNLHCAVDSKCPFDNDLFSFGQAGFNRVEISSAGPEEYFTPVRSDKPALFLSGARDPVTPVSGAHEVASGWPNSLHVVVPNGGHGQGGPCIDGLVLQLIRSGSVEGIDPSCVRSARPTDFLISRN